MDIQELAQNIVREFVLRQLNDPGSDLWEDVEDDPDVLNLTDEEYKILVTSIREVKISVH